MTAPWKVSIRSKILVVLSGVVILAVALYLYLASRIFYEDKTLLIYELNQTNVQTLGSDVDTYFSRVFDTLKTIAVLNSRASSELAQVLPVVTGENEGFLRVGIAGARSGEQNRILETWDQPIKIYSKDATYLDELRRLVPIPVDKVMRDGTWVRNATQPGEDSPPVMTVAASFGGQVIYADLLLDRLAKTFSREGIAKTYLIDSEGYTLVRSEAGAVGIDQRSSDPLIRAAAASKVRSEVRKFKEGDDSYLGSFFKTGLGGVVVTSKIDTDEAFSAARILVRKSLLYGLIVITAAFLVALFLSHSLTEPIEKLVEATRRIAQGDFNLLVPISSGDELAVLAASFNTMTGDLKSSREQIEEYSRNLEQKVADRTAKLEAQTLAIRETQEALVRTTRLASVGEVAGRAAHEVLNPLTNITARLEKLRNQDLKRDGQDLALAKEILEAWAKAFSEAGTSGLMNALSAPSATEKGKTLLEEDLGNLSAVTADALSHLKTRNSDVDFLLKECARISKIVNGMRQLTRVSGSRRQVDVHALLDEALSSMGDLFSKNEILIEKNYCGGSPKIHADHDELLQVLSNLLRNSLQALQEGRRTGSVPQGGARIFVSTERPPLSPSRIHIRIGDNGPGVEPGSFERIFEASFTTKSVEEGTGLGLAIARRFIRAHDGDITLALSRPGVQTIFLIDLPEHTEARNVS